MKIFLDVNVFEDVFRQRQGWEASVTVIKCTKHFHQKEIRILTPEEFVEYMEPKQPLLRLPLCFVSSKVSSVWKMVGKAQTELEKKEPLGCGFLNSSITSLSSCSRGSGFHIER